MSSDHTNAERQRRYRARKRGRNTTVTPAIAPTDTVTDVGDGIVHKDGHTYYTHRGGRVYAVVCCGVAGCRHCTGG